MRISAKWSVVGKKAWKRKLPPNKREKQLFQGYHTMPILGVPDVGVLEPVHVHLEIVVRVHVHVGNEKCVMNHPHHRHSDL